MENYINSTVSFDVNNKTVSFNIVHNLPEIFGMSLQNAVDNWIFRTEQYTAESLCDYINSKSHMTNNYAYTEKQYQELIKDH